ncbi:MAG: site-specific DNA-methyltransferase [Patescibacteria group bacterium]
MPQDFYSKLDKILKKDDRFVDPEKELLKNEVIDKAYKVDKRLIELLLEDTEVKKKFFIEIKGCWVFDINNFVAYIEDKHFLNDSYTKFKNKIGLNINGKFLNERKEVALVWPFKDCVLEGGMTKEDEKRKEIFFNEILAQDEIDKLFAPKVLTNWKRYTEKGVEDVKEMKRDKDGTIRENLIIKGNNLLVLHSLKKQFQGKTKLIYIDPPYNIGNDSFGYNDNFNHSTWLTFMKNRLEVAKDLLRNDGLIFVQIDDVEYGYLRVLMDEIFSRENYISTITVKSKTPSGVGQESVIFDITERVVVYAKNSNELSVNNIKIFDEIVDDNSKTIDNYNLVIQSLGKEKYLKELKTGKGKPIKVYSLNNFKFIRNPKNKCNREWAYFNFENIFRLSPANGGLMKKITPQLPDGPCCIEYMPEKGKYANKKVKVYFIDKDMVVMLSETAIKNDKEECIEKMVNIHNNWTEESLWQGIAAEGGVKLKNGKKPEALIKRIVDIATNERDIILDYHAGSGTTCAVAHKMGRQWIGVEQLDYSENNPEQRMKNVIDGDKTGISKEVGWKGGGDFIYCELAKYNEEFVGKIEKADISPKLLNIWKEMKEKSFLNYIVKPEEFDKNTAEFKKLSLIKQKETLLQFLNKNQLYVNLSDIEDKDFRISKEDKELSGDFYG